MMSTDTDRIVNFCPSFHAFWSLPLQVFTSKLINLYFTIFFPSLSTAFVVEMMSYAARLYDLKNFATYFGKFGNMEVDY